MRITSQKRDRPKNNKKKKKAEEDLSVNFYIMKARKRLKNMNTAEKKQESAKRSDKYDLKKHKNKFKKSQE